MNKAIYDYLFKFVVLGEDKVGKTSLSARLTDDSFNEEYMPTIGK
jgi:GTPase SAR1 family protein